MKRSKKILISASLFLGLGVSSLFWGQSNFKTSQSIINLDAGVSTCLGRVSQSFTSLMIGNLSSGYLTKDFRNLTDECFNEVNRVFKSLAASLDTSKEGAKFLNNITSDTHWFLERVEKTHNQLLKDRDSFNLTDSNLPLKFSEIENEVHKFKNELDRNNISLNEQYDLAGTLSSLFFLSMVISLGLFSLELKNQKKAIVKLESYASSLASENIEAYQIDRLLENVLLTSYPNVWELFKNYHEKLLLKETKETFKLEDEVKESAPSFGTDLSHAFNSAYNQLKDQAFSKGIVIDFELDKNLFIKGDQDALEGILMSTLSYAFYKLDDSEGVKKVILRSKPLGSSAFFKMIIEGVTLNHAELDFINEEEKSENIYHELKIMKELSSILEATVGVKNKILAHENKVSSEIEIIFERAKEGKVSSETSLQVKTQLKSLVKGKKKDLLKEFRSEA